MVDPVLWGLTNFGRVLGGRPQLQGTVPNLILSCFSQHIFVIDLVVVKYLRLYQFLAFLASQLAPRCVCFFSRSSRQTWLPGGLASYS
jgi:hypothetical protein